MTQPPTGTARPVRRLRLGHSPDSDDAFMFYALASGAVGAAAVRFDTVHRDIQTLNRLALRGELEITALSAHAYAHVWHHYALFTHGASMGRQYGPVIVAPEPLELDALLATATSPKIVNECYPSVKRIAKAWVTPRGREHVDYFCKNRESGIQTFQDDDILTHLRDFGHVY